MIIIWIKGGVHICTFVNGYLRAIIFGHQKRLECLNSLRLEFLKVVAYDSTIGPHNIYISGCKQKNFPVVTFPFYYIWYVRSIPDLALNMGKLNWFQIPWPMVYYEYGFYMFLAKWGLWPGLALVASQLPNEDLLGVHLFDHFWRFYTNFLHQKTPHVADSTHFSLIFWQIFRFLNCANPCWTSSHG